LSVFGARIDVYFSECVVKCRLLNTLIRSSLEPVGQHAKLATALKFIDKLRNRAHSDREEKLLYVVFVTVKIQKGSKHLGGGSGVDLKKINLNALELFSGEEIAGEILNVAVHIAKVDKRARVRELSVH